MSKPPSKPLLGTKIALLVSNGFNEQDLTVVQRALLDAGANMRIVSAEQGLVHSWNGEGWGHHYAIDSPLGSALGADFSMLVIPGGTAGMDKLKLTAHTKPLHRQLHGDRKACGGLRRRHQYPGLHG